MGKQLRRTIALDPMTDAKLQKLAELRARAEWGETPNVSDTVREAINALSDARGVSVSAPNKKKDKRPA